jgi:hypothetical protein
MRSNNNKENNKSKQINLISITIISIILVMILSFISEIKLAIIIAASLWLLTSYIVYKEKIGQELIIAFLFALAWTSYYTYEYTSKDWFFGGKINLFPLICWTAGLVLTREVYERLRGKYRFLKVTIIYLALLFLFEYIGYNLLNIQLNSNFSDLLNLGIMHAPLFMKIFYLIVGPVYLLITDYLKVK